MHYSQLRYCGIAALLFAVICIGIGPSAEAAVHNTAADQSSTTVNPNGQFIDPNPVPWPGDYFGNAVAVSSDGSVAVVADSNATGATGNVDQGRVYVYQQVNGAWSQVAELTPSNTGTDSDFGESVSISADGTEILATAINFTSVGEGYLFIEPSGGWSGDVSESAQLVGTDSTVDSQFGSSAALTPDGTEAVIGAQYQGGATAGQGEAYVFTQPSGGWSGTVAPAAFLEPASTISEFTGIGTSIAVSDNGSEVAVGDDFMYGSGGVLVYDMPAGGWAGEITAASVLTPSDPQDYPYGLFGDAVSMTGDGSTIAVGSLGQSSEGFDAAGAVYTFVDAGGNWNQTNELFAPDPGEGYQLGYSLAIAPDGSSLLIGAPNVVVNGIPGVGAAYVFDNSGGSFTLSSELVPASPFDGETMGMTVSMFDGGAGAVIGAPAFSVPEPTDIASLAPEGRTLAPDLHVQASLGLNRRSRQPSVARLASGSDAQGGTAFAFAVPTGEQAPAITSASSTNFTVGSTGTFSVTTTGYPTGALSETGSLPSGVTFVDNGNGTATLSGRPAAETGRSYPITITANNGVSPNATQNFTLSIDQSPQITSVGKATFKLKEKNTFTVTATGFPTATLTEVGGLPPGVTFTDKGNGTATIAGKPKLPEKTYTIRITASNGISPSVTQTFKLKVT